jgi:hypothetical protein
MWKILSILIFVALPGGMLPKTNRDGPFFPWVTDWGRLAANRLNGSNAREKRSEIST